jgi:hypothetical protein
MRRKVYSPLRRDDKDKNRLIADVNAGSGGRARVIYVWVRISFCGIDAVLAFGAF